MCRPIYVCVQVVSIRGMCMLSHTLTQHTHNVYLPCSYRLGVLSSARKLAVYIFISAFLTISSILWRPSSCIGSSILNNFPPIFHLFSRCYLSSVYDKRLPLFNVETFYLFTLVCSQSNT